MTRLFKALFLILLFLPNISLANVAISSWQENVDLTATGKTSTVLIQGRIKDIPPNRVMTSFMMGFGGRQNMKITKVLADNQPAKYEFTNNKLNIFLPKGKTNNDNLSIYFSYEEIYDKINEFLRQEEIYIPNFAAGANAIVNVNFPWNLDSATLNYNITTNGNSFTYNGIVPSGGVRERIKLTPSSTKWRVVLEVKVNSDKPLKKAQVDLPIYFENSGQKIENSITTATTIPLEQIIKNNRKTLSFDTSENSITVKNKAQIYLGQKNLLPILRDPEKYLNVSQEELILLSPILDKIETNPKYHNLPLYAKIGQFTHDFIHYDKNYVGKLPKIKEILQTRTGVCTEYANLFNSLAKIAGIPSLIINGAACGEYDSCQGHAWNLIYYNDNWIYVDPTWNLMSGIVSSSHVYFNENDNDGVIIQYFKEEAKKMDYSIDFKMTKLP